MRDVTREIIHDLKINKLKYDMMGYKFTNINELSFHHLIVSKERCILEHIPKQGYLKWNGAILKQNSAHDYLHLIQRMDYDRFLEITSLLIEEKCSGQIRVDILKAIRDVLLSFEEEYKEKTTDGKHLIIKRRYISNRIEL